MKNKILNSIVKLSFLFSAVLGFTFNLQAEVNLIHTAPGSQDLGDPGSNLTLEVRAQNLKNTNVLLKAYISRDNQLFTAIDVEPDFNEQYELLYKIPIKSPNATLWYRFVLEAGDQQLASKSYSVKRECLPDGVVVPADISSNLSNLNPEQLANTALRLEREIMVQESSVDLLEEFKEFIDG